MSVIASMIVKIGADIADLKQSMEKVGDALDNAGVGFGKLFTAQVTAEAAMRAMSAVVNGFVGFLQGAVAESSRFNSAMVGLASVAGAFGVKADDAKNAARRLASDGLMTVGDAASGLKNLLAAGFSLPEATRMMEAFKDSAAFARQGSLGFGEAIVSATEGIKNGNSILVDNAGITKNLSVILKEAGFGADALGQASSNAKVRLAILNGVIREASVFSGDAARLSETYSGAVSKLDTQWRFLQTTLGDSITQNATVAAGMDLLSRLMSQLNTSLTNNGKSFDMVSGSVISLVKIFTFLLGALDLVQLGFNGLIAVYGSVLYSTNALGQAIGNAFIAALEKVIAVLPESVSNFLKLKDGLASLKSNQKAVTDDTNYYAAMVTGATDRSIEWGNSIQTLKRQLEDAIPKLESTRGQVVQLGTEKEKLARKTDEAAEKLKGFAKEVADVEKALKSAAANNAMADALDKYKSKIIDVVQQSRIMGKTIPEEIQKAYDAIKNTEALKKVAAVWESTAKTILEATKGNITELGKLQDEYAKQVEIREGDSLNTRLATIFREMNAKRDALNKQGGYYKESLKAIDDLERITAENATAAWNKHIQEAQQNLPGIGKTFRDVLKDVPGIIQSAFEGGGGMLGGIKSIGSKLGAGLMENLFTSATGLGQTLSKGLVDTLGGNVGGALAGMLGPLGSALGSLIGPLMGKVASLFKKPEYKKVLSDVGKDWGVSISESLAKEIADFEKKFNVSKNLAEQLNLSKILSEAGGLTDQNIAKFQAQALNLFSVVKSGSKASGQAMSELNNYFSELQKRLEDNGGIADRSFVQFIQKAEQAGVAVSGLADFILKQADATTKGLKDFTDNAVVTTQRGATAMGTAVATLFYEYQKGGLTATEALAKISPIIDNLTKQFLEAGFEGGDAFNTIKVMAALAADKIAGPAITAINGLGAALVGMNNSGILTEDMFSALAAQITDTFNGLVAQGYDGDAAMRLIQPTLQTIWQLQKDFGYAVDEGTQALLDQAEKAGLVGDKHRDAMDRMAIAMERVADILEQTFGKAVPKALDESAQAAQRLKDKIDSIPNRKKVVVDVDSTGLPGDDPGRASVPGLRTGGIVTKPTLAVIAEGGESEAVIPLSKLGRMGGGDTYQISITFDRPLMRDAAERDHVVAMVDEAIARRIKVNKRLSVNG